MQKIYLSVLLLLLIGCRKPPQKKLDDLLKKYPELVRMDTLEINDTIITQKVVVDSSFYYNSKDTIYLRDGKASVKYFFSKDTVFLQAACDPDSIPYAVNVPYPVVQQNVDKRTTWQKLKDSLIDGFVPACLAVILFVLLSGIVKRIFNK